jgi:hypothetical protein
LGMRIGLLWSALVPRKGVLPTIPWSP